jgi:hypothetical protein
MIEVKADAGQEFAKERNSGEMVALTFIEGLAVGMCQ